MKILKIAGFFIISLLLAVILLKVLSGYINQQYLVPYLIGQVENKTNNRYTLTIKDETVSAGLFTIDLIIGHTEFKRDHSQNRNSGIDLLDKFDVYFSFDSLEISVFNPLSYLFNKKIKIRQIEFINPIYTVRKNIAYTPEESADNAADSVPENINDADSVTIHADTTAWKEFRNAQRSFRPVIQLDQLLVDKLNFFFYDGRTKAPVNEIYGMDMEFSRLKIDMAGKLTAGDIRVSIDSVSALVSKKMARLDIFKMSIHPDSMVINNLHFRHIVDRYAINRIKGFRASWLDVQVSDFRLLGLHPLMLTTDSIIDIDKASIGDIQLLLFKDKSDQVINPAHKALPPEEIRSIPVKLKIDTVEILHGDLTVEMQAPDAKRPGKITLNHFNAGIFNITNIPEYLVSKPEMELHTNFALMDSARINLTAGFRIDSPEDQFRVTCKAEPFNIQILNEFLGSQFSIDFSSGFIKGLNFEFEGNNKANVGTMDLEYDDFKIEKYQNFKQYIDSKPHTGFIAFMGNTLIPNNRSKEDPHYKPAVIYYEKEYNRDFIHGTIMSLLSGLSSSMGFSGHNLQKQEEKARELDASDIKKSEEVAEKKAEKAEKKIEKEEKK